MTDSAARFVAVAVCLTVIVMVSEASEFVAEALFVELMAVSVKVRFLKLQVRIMALLLN